jgi:hypothetical protein
MFWTTRRGGLDLVGASFLWIYDGRRLGMKYVRPASRRAASQHAHQPCIRCSMRLINGLENRAPRAYDAML